MTHSSRRIVRWSAAATAALVYLAAAPPASAIVQGKPAGALSRHVVRVIIHRGWCTGTVVGRQAILTAGHCLKHGGYYVSAGGKRFDIVSTSPAGDDAVLARLSAPLPPSLVPIRVDRSGGNGGSYIIAGFGTAQEGARPKSAGLRQAELVREDRHNALVDPRRSGDVSASACLGDSGGPVVRRDARGYVLVGMITKASRYSPTYACGHMTHYTAASGSWASDTAVVTEAHTAQTAASTERRKRRAR